MTVIKIDEDTYKLMVQKEAVGHFKLKKFPYCAAIYILCNVEVYESYRGKGYGKFIVEHSKKLAKALNAIYLVCTDLETNVPMRKILNEVEFCDLLYFRNKNTGNLVNLSFVKL